MRALLEIVRNEDGDVIDTFGQPIKIGTIVRVVATGYGASLGMTQGTWEVVGLGPKRAKLKTHTAGFDPEWRPTVHYSCLSVYKPKPKLPTLLELHARGEL